MKSYKMFFCFFFLSLSLISSSINVALADVVNLGEFCGADTGDAPHLGLYCNYTDKKCGIEGKPGVATSIPVICPAYVKPICGCDGITYQNSCYAAQRGVSVQSSGICKGKVVKFSFGFIDPRKFPDFIFVLKDKQKIARAREILKTKTKFQVIGRITKAPADYNKNYLFHLDPNTIIFAENSPEVCDGNPRYMEEHLDEVGGSANPDAIWCPWSSFLKKELNSISTKKKQK